MLVVNNTHAQYCVLQNKVQMNNPFDGIFEKEYEIKNSLHLIFNNLYKI